MVKPKLIFEKWPTPLISRCNSRAKEVGTIRTIPENYFVCSVDDRGEGKFTLKFRRGFEPNTDDIDKDYVLTWFAQQDNLK